LFGCAPVARHVRVTRQSRTPKLRVPYLQLCLACRMVPHTRTSRLPCGCTRSHRVGWCPRQSVRSERNSGTTTQKPPRPLSPGEQHQPAARRATPPATYSGPEPPPRTRLLSHQEKAPHLAARMRRTRLQGGGVRGKALGTASHPGSRPWCNAVGAGCVGRERTWEAVLVAERAIRGEVETDTLTELLDLVSLVGLAPRQQPRRHG